MFKYIIKKHALTFSIIAFPSLIGSLLVIFRISRTGYYTFYFLLWNLFLAWIPLIFSCIAEYMFQKNKRTTKLFWLVFFTWFLFYPNAPYIITDLIHLKISKLMPIWFDLALVIFFAWTGLFISYISLFMMQKIVKKKLNKMWSWIFVVFTIASSSFGVYLGRFLRWNSWDIVYNFKGLLNDVTAPFIYPLSHKWPLFFTFIFFIISLSIYLTFYFSARISNYNDNIYE